MNIRGLGYLGLTARNLAGWRAFATDFMGLSEAPSHDAESLRFKMDDRQWRISVEEGPSDGVAFLGWELAGPGELAAAVEDLRSAGATVRLADRGLAERRGVAEIAMLEDPAGHPLELFWGPKEDFEPFRSPAGVSGFKIGDLGLGHVLVKTPDAGPPLDFYRSVLGFRLTDFIARENGRSAQFLRCTPRHHSIAFMDMLPQSGLDHFMVEVMTLDDLGHAYDRALAGGAEIINSLGRHTNDKMISFYVKTPSGFGLEYGWGGMLIDDATWRVIEFQGRGDLWGHHGPMMDQIAAARRNAPQPAAGSA